MKNSIKEIKRVIDIIEGWRVSLGDKRHSFWGAAIWAKSWWMRNSWLWKEPMEKYFRPTAVPGMHMMCMKRKKEADA